MKLPLFVIALLTAASLHEAKAQFLGDVFFENPSLLSNSGDEITLKAAVFTGSEVFGSADFTLNFDKSLLKVNEVNFQNDIYGTSATIINGDLVSLRMIAANGVSTEKPSGIVPIAEVKATVLASPGARFNISPENHNVFIANRSEITNGSLDAEIVVQSIGSSLLAKPFNTTVDKPVDGPKQLVEAKPGTELYERARKLRLEGELVRLQEVDGTFIDVIIMQKEE